jgi:two-component system, cell cycle response regulator
MKSQSRPKLLLTFAVFVLAYAGLVFLYQQQTDRYMQMEGEKQVLGLLLGHRAIYNYIVQVQRPELYRLKREGKLYEEYFSPKVMSFTYIARSIKEYLNQEHKKEGLPEFYFKLATDNPRNPINQANPEESALLKKMNEQDLKQYREIVEVDGKPFLYFAIPVEPSKPGCLVCHGNPADAPKELIEQYGDKMGFHENLGDIRALISIRIPLDDLRRQANELFWILALATLAVLAAIYGLIHAFINHLEITNAKLLQLSSEDYLTHISNRRAFLAALEQMLKEANRYKSELSVLMLDLDHFKQVNDRHGHAVGDEVLKFFSTQITGLIRDSDLFARWGGEEFVIAMPQQGLDNAFNAAEKLRQSIKETVFPTGLKLTCSIGIARFEPGIDSQALIDRADQALYQAKQDGRDRSNRFQQGPGTA